MRFDLRPPRQRLCGYNRIISAEVLCENRKSHNRVSKGRWQCKGKAVYVQVVKKKNNNTNIVCSAVIENLQ